VTGPKTTEPPSDDRRTNEPSAGELHPGALAHDADPRTLLCYCTNLTYGIARSAARAGQWPPPGHERSGKLCTGCLGDLLHTLRAFGIREL
jgi:hypothetical protein